jgi:tRNA (cmo5U34)-methyltransferase
MHKDKLFNKKMKPSSFSFNQEVAEVFPDMLERSIPGYGTTINSIRYLASKYSKKGTNCYDLGCSLGASSIALGEGAIANDCRIIAVDKSSSMTKRFSEIIKQKELDLKIQILNEDILDTEIINASIVIMNFTLQFIGKQDRQLILDRIYNGLNDGGLLLLSEKIIQSDKKINDLLIELHENFKLENLYSREEIENKKESIKNVLIEDEINTHQSRLSKSGFARFGIWFQHFNFVSYIAIK